MQIDQIVNIWMIFFRDRGEILKNIERNTSYLFILLDDLESSKV